MDTVDLVLLNFALLASRSKSTLFLLDGGFRNGSLGLTIGTWRVASALCTLA
jgi:hypothetical protein